MILFLAHSCTLRAEALELKAKLEAAGHTVQMPCDPEVKTEYRIHTWNAALIRQADAVLALWNGYSDGCYGDVCMAIALGGKPVYVKYPEWQEVDRRTLKPHMRRAWALFSELETIEEFMERTPAATHGGE
jgi:nucleoside 2-deoxyribosyltransferase